MAVQGLGWSDWLALSACGLAVAWDLRTRRIPNWLTASAAAFGLVGHLGQALLAGTGGNLGSVGTALAGSAVGLLVCLPLSSRGLLGFGDTKLVGAVGMCVGFPLILHVTVYTMLAGGPVALAHGLLARRLGSVAANMSRRDALTAGRIDGDHHALHAMPYALAIALGTAWAVLARSVRLLALL